MAKLTITFPEDMTPEQAVKRVLEVVKLGLTQGGRIPNFEPMNSFTDGSYVVSCKRRSPTAAYDLRANWPIKMEDNLDQ